MPLIADSLNSGEIVALVSAIAVPLAAGIFWAMKTYFELRRRRREDSEADGESERKARRADAELEMRLLTEHPLIVKLNADIQELKSDLATARKQSEEKILALTARENECQRRLAALEVKIQLLESRGK